jgi:hypothetical protein
MIPQKADTVPSKETKTIKLTVTPEGREGVWLAEKANVVAWIKSQKWQGGQIHNFIDSGALKIGADWPVAKVVAWVNKCERLAILTGDAQRHNMGHALAVITDNLYMFDIGPIAESDVDIAEAK